MAKLLRYGIAAVWLANGLLCKVLHLVPRHEAIVARILGPAYAGPLTRLIGMAEIGLGLWVLTGRRPRPTAALQIGLVLTMNALELWLAPDLLLWGPLNFAFALLFALVVFWWGRLEGEVRSEHREVRVGKKNLILSAVEESPPLRCNNSDEAVEILRLRSE
ncbi:DoxX-like family protein [Hymenobacter psychrophilus]|uniref:DoxX-like family protein n=1 Tax=Hymenobacter psychrophilus TaxID=651662 RepID=A0A1H3B3T7_9BACT|nr:DoxX-like family protein [Hymenobacter psychrophilus]SDX36064.1 DoxX-like family protein [Hymenobacter psychrophilus]